MGRFFDTKQTKTELCELGGPGSAINPHSEVPVESHAGIKAFYAI